MSTKAYAVQSPSSVNDRVHIVTWTGLANGDDGDPIQMTGSSDRTIQFDGTFGTGGTIILEGSNDGTNYYALTDPQGNNISKTAGSLETVVELTKYIRPRVSAGDGTTSLTACLLLKLVR